MRIDNIEPAHRNQKPLSEIKDVSVAIQQALYEDCLKDSIGFICQWEEYRKNNTASNESCYGYAVVSLLKIYGIDIDTLDLRLGN